MALIYITNGVFIVLTFLLREKITQEMLGFSSFYVGKCLFQSKPTYVSQVNLYQEQVGLLPGKATDEEPVEFRCGIVMKRWCLKWYIIIFFAC